MTSFPKLTEAQECIVLFLKKLLSVGQGVRKLRSVRQRRGSDPLRGRGVLSQLT